MSCNSDWKRRKQALALAALLPDDRREAIIVLDMARDLIGELIVAEDEGDAAATSPDQ
jgi:hypothetical protein